MEIFDAVLYSKDFYNDCYILLKNGDCVFETRRCISFNLKKDILCGDVVKVEFSPNGNFEDNPYFKILEKKNSNFFEREQNLIFAIRLFINNAYSSASERNNRAHTIVNNVPFFESNYFDEITNLFDALKKFYTKEKLQVKANFVKNIFHEFKQNSINTLGIVENDKFNKNYAKLCVQNIRKQYFSLFTSTKKVVDAIHELIKNSANENLNKIETFIKNCKNSKSV